MTRELQGLCVVGLVVAQLLDCCERVFHVKQVVSNSDEINVRDVEVFVSEQVLGVLPALRLHSASLWYPTTRNTIRKGQE